MKNQKQIQIDWELFLNLYVYFFDDDAPQGTEADAIRRQLGDKFERIVNRELFTRYKRSPTGEEREAARKAYLDHRELHENFRSSTERRMEEL